MANHDVIHKTGSTQRSATPSEENRAMATGDLHTKFREDRSSIPEICLQTDRHTDIQTGWSEYSAPLPWRTNNHYNHLFSVWVCTSL